MKKNNLYIFVNAKTQMYGVLSLNEDGTVGVYDNPAESSWGKDENGRLILKNKEGKTTSVFNQVGDEYVCTNKWHFLKPYKKVFPFTENILDFKTDKFFHHHLAFYEEKFKYIKNEKIKIVEMGCLGCESIKYWLNYFPHAQVFGLDISLVSFVHERFRFYSCDQRNNLELKALADLIGEVDIFIDDGAHFYQETKNTFDAFWPKIKRDGFFIIEDWDWMTDLITEIMHNRGELGGGVKGTRGIKGDIGIKHLEISTNDNRAYALFQKR